MATDPELLSFRQKIDEVDGKIAQLLIERIGIVGQVGEHKRRTAPGICPIRPGREADMIRKIVTRFEKTPFPPAAGAAIWRTLIGVSTGVEASLIVSVFAPDKESDLVWMAREYYGPFVQIVRQPQIKRVIGDIMDGKAAVGIVPMPRSSDTACWWTNLTQQEDAPKIFARVPFVHYGAPSHDAPSALAIGRFEPEHSGDDRSLLMLEADHNVSQHRLQGAFAAAKLEASWLNVAALTPSARHHLIEVKGFITPQDEAMRGLLYSLGASVFNASFLGSYAVPIVLDTGHAK